MLFLQYKTTLIKFCTTFLVKQARLLPSECTSLLLRSKRLQQNCLPFFKTQCVLQGLMKLSLLQKVLLLEIFFALLGEKESKYHKRSLFCSFPMKRDLSLSHQPPKHFYINFSSLSQFQAFFWILSYVLRYQNSAHQVLHYNSPKASKAFDLYVQQFARAQQASTGNFPAIFQKTEESSIHALRINKTKITSENAFFLDYLG